MSEENRNIRWLLSGLPEMKEEALEDSKKYFSGEIELINYMAATLASLAFFTMENKSDKSILLSEAYPASDWNFHSHLTDLINTFLSIKELCINGFDTQARSLVRVFDERIYQNLILFSCPEDYKSWKNAKSSKQTHFELFSRKKSIFKKVFALEKKYLDIINDHEVLAMRKEYEEYYSDNIHGASISIHIGSLAYPFGDLDDGRFVSNLYGRASSCSYQTLHHAIGQMAYFVTMINFILEDIHSINKIINNDLIKTFKNNRHDVMKKVNTIFKKRKPNTYEP